MKTLRYAFVVLAAVVFTSFNLASGALAQNKVIKYGYPLPMVEFMPLYAAQQQGFFRDENISVETFALSTGDKITLALASGSVDIANYTPDWFVRAMEKGAPIKIIAGASNAPVYSLVTSANITSYADLKGKRVAVSALKASDAYVMRKMLAAHGLQPSDYDMLQAGSSSDRAAALKAGSVAATLLAPPYDSVIIGEGYKRLDVSTATIKQYTWLSQATRDDWAKANKPALLGFIRAWVKGTRWAYDPKNKAEAIRILAKELKLDDARATTAYEMYYASPTETVAKDAAIDLVGLQTIIDAVGEQGDLGPAPFPKAAKTVDSEYLNEALKTLK